MLGASAGLAGASGDGATAEVGASSSIPGGGTEGVGRSGGGGGGNRWPRQETLALLRIRSDMDAAFRDSSLKGPLWEEVSRKMAELGFQRSAKKCKEKFENVYKYHKRTKDGRSSKPDGKTYRFFDQLEALENAPTPPPPPPPRPQPQPPSSMAAGPMPTTAASLSHRTVSSTSPSPVSVVIPTQTANNHPIDSSSFQPFQPPPPPQAMNASNPPQTHTFQAASLLSNSTSSSTSSDDDIQRRRGRKRKWKDFFHRLMKDVMRKQEELQKKFLDTLEKRERDRTAREEVWRVQEMARMNREHELLVQERSMAAAKDAAVIAFLQKVTEQHNLQIPISAPSLQVSMQVQPPEDPQPPPPPPPPPQRSNLAQPPAAPMAAPPLAAPTQTNIVETSRTDNRGDNSIPTSSSRWPKAEVQALIKLRTGLELKYQESGPKGPLWEEISAAMAKLGYHRSSKRCKEKWENINKYFKKVKEGNKKRPEDSKTCPYFHQLEAIYKEKAKNEVPTFTPGYSMEPENPMVPIMAQPEQQWPLPQQQPQQESAMAPDQDDDNDSDNNDHDEDDDEDAEDEGGGYEIVANKQLPSLTNAAD